MPLETIFKYKTNEEINEDITKMAPVSKGLIPLYFMLLYFTLAFSKSIQNDSNDTELIQLKETVLELSKKFQKLNESLNRDYNDKVMFYAVLTGHLSYNFDAILQFKTVIINEGNHYDPHDGIFVAPVSGIYLFSWTATGYAGNWIVTELVVEEKVIATAGEQQPSGYPSGSMTALCRMRKDDHAWIRTTGVNSAQHVHSSNDYPQTSFLGLLITKQ